MLQEARQRQVVHVVDLAGASAPEERRVLVAFVVQRLLCSHQALHEAHRVDERHESLLRVDELDGWDH